MPEAFDCFKLNGPSYINPLTGSNLIQIYLWSSYQVDLDQVKKLSTINDVNYVNNQGNSVIWYAVKNASCSAEVIKLLIHKGATVPANLAIEYSNYVKP